MALVLDLNGVKDGLCLNANSCLNSVFTVGSMIGHGEKSCEIKIKEAKNGNLNEGQFGDWLRAANGRINNKGRVTRAIDLNDRRLDNHKE